LFPQGIDAARAHRDRATPPIPKMKTPPVSEDTDEVFYAFTSGKVAALG